jgi:hypothetical protein
MSVNETAMQKVLQHNFPQPWWCFGKNWPTEVMEIEKLYEFDKNLRFFTTSCDPYMGHTLRLFNTFHHKKGKKDGF